MTNAAKLENNLPSLVHDAYRFAKLRKSPPKSRCIACSAISITRRFEHEARSFGWVNRLSRVCWTHCDNRGRRVWSLAGSSDCWRQICFCLFLRVLSLPTPAGYLGSSGGHSSPGLDCLWERWVASGWRGGLANRWLGGSVTRTMSSGWATMLAATDRPRSISREPCQFCPKPAF
jgi:hypothetical protein